MSRGRIEGAAVPILLFALALLSPIGISTVPYWEGGFIQRVVAPVWEFYLTGPLAGAFNWELGPWHLTSVNTLAQLLLAVVTSLYYLGIGNRKLVVISGLVSPLVYMKGWISPAEWLEWWMYYPIPVMLVVVVTVIAIHPARRVSDQLGSGIPGTGGEERNRYVARRRIKGAAVPAMLFALALLSPIGILRFPYWEEGFIQRVVAPVWEFHLTGPLAGAFNWELGSWPLTSVDTLAQLLLALVTSLYYLGIGNRKLVVLSGLVSPLVNMRAWLSPAEWLEWSAYYPLPVMLLIVVTVIAIHPARRRANQLRSDSVETKVTEVESTRE